MRRRLLLVVPTLFAMLLVSGVAVALSACGGGQGRGSAHEEAKSRPLPQDPGALRPGEYRSEEFKPSL